VADKWLEGSAGLRNVFFSWLSSTEVRRVLSTLAMLCHVAVEVPVLVSSSLGIVLLRTKLMVWVG